MLGTNNPDLSPFRNRGGKLLIWRGWDDTQIPPDGSMEYYGAVAKRMRGRLATDPFVRLFMPPDMGNPGAGKARKSGMP